MSGPSEATGRTALPKLWRRWTAVVEQFARQKRGRHRLSEPVYDALHRDLLRACRRLADASDERSRCFYKGLEYLAQPWLRPSVLAKADGEVLTDLLERCRRAERQLLGRTGIRLAGACAWLGLTLAATVACFVLLECLGDRDWLRLYNQLSQELRALRWTIGSTDRSWIWMGGTGLAALILTWVVIRSARS